MSKRTKLTPIDELSHLDDRQREAVCADILPIWVNAGPGAGKTRVIVERIKYLITNRNIATNCIIALTFTNKAAKEMQDRIMRTLITHNNNNHDKNAIYSKVQCETFHAFCLKILRKYGEYIGLNRNFGILTKTQPIITQILKQNKQILSFIKQEKLNRDKIAIHRIENIIAAAKRHIENAQEFMERVDRKDFDYNNKLNNNQRNEMIKLYELAAKIYLEYEKELTSQNKLDFNDLLLKTMQLFNSNKRSKILDIIVSTNKYSHFVIDEFQDTNCIQFLIAKTLILHRYKKRRDFKSIMVVGDNDQTIFSWRGSQNFHTKFKNTFPDYLEVQLVHNYRSTKNILNIANYIINCSGDSDRKHTEMITDCDGNVGEMVIFEQCSSDQDEAHFIISKLSEIYQEFRRENPHKLFNLDNTAILYRASAQTRVIEEKLSQSMLKYKISGGLSFYERREIVEIILFLKILNNVFDDKSLKQIFKSSFKLFTGIGDAMIEKIIRYGKDINLSFQQSLFKIRQIEKISAAKQDQIVHFLKIVVKLRTMKDDIMCNISDLMEEIIKEIEYKKHIYSIIKNKNDADDKWQNVTEFIKIANEFDHNNENNDKLTDFLQYIALRQPLLDYDDSDGGEHKHPFCAIRGRIELSTIHKSKGLEWRNVFVIGCSHGQLPHFRAIAANDIEEERRLTFVAVTRAQKRLFLSYAMYRNDHQNKNSNRHISKTSISQFFKGCPLESIQYNRYYDNKHEKKKKKSRKNVFKKRKKYANNDQNKNKNGFQTANINYNGLCFEDKGIKLRNERKKMVEKFGTGFQKASALENNENEVKIRNNKSKKRKFKIPRMVKNKNKNHNLCVEGEKENIEPKKLIKTNNKNTKKRKLEMDENENKNENKKPAKKKRKKNKKNKLKPDSGQKSILNFFSKR